MRRLLAGSAALALALLLDGLAMSAGAVCGGGAPAYWYDPMMPGQRFDQPGKSPFMDMALVPKCADGTPGAAGGIAIEPRVVQNLGIRLATVEQGRFTRIVDTVGAVAVDEHRIEVVSVRQPGWIERLDVRAAGDAVRRGQRLAGIFSPELYATQQDLLIARRAGEPRLIKAARQRLALYGVAEAEIARLEKNGTAERLVSYYAPFDGYVMELGTRQGAAVEPGTALFTLADLDTVWLTAEVSETQAAWIEPGDPALAEVPAWPGERFAGRVDYLYPELTAATRTLKLRIVLDNPGQRLRPGMFAAIHVQGTPREQVVTVPSEAVITTGIRSVVIVAEDERHFRPSLVQVGAEQDGRSEILDGLRPGQVVVASGQFLIDSEASLRGAFDRLTGGRTDATPPGIPGGGR